MKNAKGIIINKSQYKNYKSDGKLKTKYNIET